MKVVLLTTRGLSDPTYGAVLGGLEEAYRRRGHEVLLAGFAGAALRGADLVHWHLGAVRRAEDERAARACAASGARVVATLHSWRNPDADRTGAAWRPAALSRLLRGASLVSLPSRAAAEALAADAPGLAGRVAVVPNGIDLSAVRRAAPERRARPFVLCSARLAPYKGVDLLLAAWAELSGEFPELELVVCGGGRRAPYRRLARLLGVERSVAFLGLVPRARSLALAKACRAAAVPSRYESFGLSALEAMACGKAVVAARCGGPEELIKDGRSGLLVPPKDPAALARALRRVLADGGLRARLGAAAKKAAAAYSWDRAAAAYLLIDSPEPG